MLGKYDRTNLVDCVVAILDLDMKSFASLIFDFQLQVRKICAIDVASLAGERKIGVEPGSGLTVVACDIARAGREIFVVQICSWSVEIFNSRSTLRENSPAEGGCRSEQLSDRHVEARGRSDLLQTVSSQRTDIYIYIYI
jgi:hypothetical protein